MRRLTILMIEAEQPDGLTSRKLIVEAMKHNVLTAYSLDEGLDLFDENVVHLVLLDSALAGPDSAAVVDRLKSRKPAVPVILLDPAPARVSEDAVPDGALERNQPRQMVALVEMLARHTLGYQPLLDLPFNGADASKTKP